MWNKWLRRNSIRVHKAAPDITENETYEKRQHSSNAPDWVYKRAKQTRSPSAYDAIIARLLTWNPHRWQAIKLPRVPSNGQCSQDWSIWGVAETLSSTVPNDWLTGLCKCKYFSRSSCNPAARCASASAASCRKSFSKRVSRICSFLLKPCRPYDYIHLEYQTLKQLNTLLKHQEEQSRRLK